MATEAGKVVVVIGEVNAESSDGSRLLSVDSPVFQDDILVTEQGERVEILFNDGTRLSQGENSRLNIDSYVYDPADPDASEMLLNVMEGTFRTITGKVAEENPDSFSVQTPLATLGIRGTTVLTFVTPEHEFHGPQSIEEGKAFVLTDQFGNMRFITDNVPIKVIDLYPDEPAGFQRILTQEELDYFDRQVPISPEAPDTVSDTDAPGAEAAPFGTGDVQTVAQQNQPTPPSLFGPVGLQPAEPLKLTAAVSAYDLFGPDDIREGAAAREPQDIMDGKVEDSENEYLPPNAQNADASINEDNAFTGQFSVGNADPDQLTFTLLADPQHGTVTLNQNGTYTYSPNANYYGQDSFTYQVVDNFGQTGSATVTIQIAPVNDDPVAQDWTYSTQSPVTDQLRAYDVDGDPLTFSLDTPPSHGNVTINPDGSFTYNPDAGYSGVDAFTFGVSDGHGGYDTGTATIQVSAEAAPQPVPTGVTWIGDAGGTTPTADNFTGTNLNDNISGLDLADILNGAGGDDIIDGGIENDTIDGGPGNDTIIGGVGLDNLTGGTGADIFRYNDAGDGGDTILDFVSGTDRIQFISSATITSGMSPINTTFGIPVTNYPGTAPGYAGTGAHIVAFQGATSPTGNPVFQIWFDPNVTTVGGETKIADVNSYVDATDITIV